MMTPEQFDSVVAGTRITPAMREAARRVMVDGVPAVEAAREAAVKPQQLNQTLRRVEAVAGLVRVVVTLPEEQRGAIEVWVTDRGGEVE
jgi:hypothetical protein